MTIDEFRGMTAEELEGPLLALWWDAQGDWKRAHEVAQDIATLDGSWVHAYLHRKEGDLWKRSLLVRACDAACREG